MILKYRLIICRRFRRRMKAVNRYQMHMMMKNMKSPLISLRNMKNLKPSMITLTSRISSLRFVQLRLGTHYYLTSFNMAKLKKDIKMEIRNLYNQINLHHLIQYNHIKYGSTRCEIRKNCSDKSMTTMKTSLFVQNNKKCDVKPDKFRFINKINYHRILLNF